MNKFTFTASVCVVFFFAACGDDGGSATRPSEESSSSVVLSSSSSFSVIPSSSSVSSPMSSWSGGGAGAIGSITDSRDGQSYKTVSIGTQTWMAQNLNYETANSYCYSNTPSNCTKYGRLYTWAAAMDSAGTWSANGKGCGDAKTCTPTYPVRGVCPTGWHLPTKAEFETLFTAVGGSSTAGTKLKSTSGWNDFEGKSGNGVDAYSFSVLPAGYGNYNEGYNFEGDDAFFWSSTELSSNGAYRMGLDYNDDNAYLYNSFKNNGFSVRCVKDGSTNKIVASSSSFAVIRSSSSIKVEVKTGSITDARDGQSYKTVSIGTQTWMAQNLNYETANSYCFSNTPSNCTKYGRLYTWAVAMDSAGTWSVNGKGCGYGKTCSPTYPVRGVCPTGWHLPTQTEWNTLFAAVGGTNTAGTKLKSTTGWNSSGNGTDDYSFSALPTGYRSNFGNYSFEGINADFWSSTEGNSYYAFIVFLRYDGGSANPVYHDKYYGFSVRCVKD